MDPATMMLIASLVSSGIGAATGGKAQRSSSFSKKQRSGLEAIMDQLNAMKGGQDITQNPQYQQGSEWLNSLFSDPEFFKSFEAPLQRQFQEQTIPDLANRFAAQGSGGSLGSTGFRNQAIREAGNLSSNIAALRGGMQQQGINQALGYAQAPFNNLMQLYNLVYGQGINNQYQPPSAGFGALAAPFAQGAAQGYASRSPTPEPASNPGQNPNTY